MGIASQAVRERALKAYADKKGTQSEIAALYGISSRTFQRWCEQYSREGSTSPKARGHRPAVYEGEMLASLDALVEQSPDATLEELRDSSGQNCSIMAVQRAVTRLGYSLKKNARGQRTKSP